MKIMKTQIIQGPLEVSFRHVINDHLGVNSRPELKVVIHFADRIVPNRKLHITAYISEW